MEHYFFLGANARRGFFSLYDQLIDPKAGDTLYILKGGPGCGKSSFMRRVAAALAEKGLDLEYILCSGDPDSLDALRVPALGLALVDGTAPHVIEPQYPGAMESYVNLGAFYDTEALHREKAGIVRLFSAYKDLYAEAYRYIAAAAGLQDGLYDNLFSDSARERLRRRVKGIAAREFPRRPGPGSTRRCFLDAFTCQGPVRLYDTALALCPRVFLLDNALGFAPFLVDLLHQAALAAGQETIICPHPLCPEKSLHLLLPQLGLCFLADSTRQPYTGEIYRHIRLDAMADPDLLRKERGQLRAMSRAAEKLLELAEKKLAEAKALHDRLEGLYNPHVDFAGVYALADELTAKLLTKKV